MAPPKLMDLVNVPPNIKMFDDALSKVTVKGKRMEAELIADALPAIRKHKDRGLTWQEILEKFNHAFSAHLAREMPLHRFRKLVKEELKVLPVNGTISKCETCGQLLINSLDNSEVAIDELGEEEVAV